MKHRVLILISVLSMAMFMGLESKAYDILVTETGLRTTSESMPKPKCNIEKIGEAYKVTYTFDSLVIVKDEVLPDKSYFLVPGFGMSETEGQASVVCGIKRFSFESRSMVEIANVVIDHVDYSWDYSPARRPQLNNSDEIFLKNDITPIEINDSFFPDIALEYVNKSVYRGELMHEIAIYPTQYNSKQQTVRINRVISFYLRELETDEDVVANVSADISFDDGMIPSVSKVLRDTDVALYKDDTDNKLGGDDGVTYDVTKHYLIITTPDFLSEVNMLAEWKRTMGYTVEIASKRDWTTESVKAYIENLYSRNSKLYYVLLVGDIDKIPTCESRMSHYSLDSKFKTDVPYSCMDGNDDFYPDIYIGRIPATDKSEALSAINKIIEYEKDPSFGLTETTAICSTYFQDGDRDGIEDRGFTYTTERIFNYIKNRTVYNNLERIYYAPLYSSPLKWSSRYGDGGDVPSHLQRPYFSWDGDKNDIIDAFNNGCNLFYHRDHGGYTGWGDPEIDSSDLSDLHNSIYPILLSIDCNVGNFEKVNNFGRKLLCMKDAGAATVVASVQPSYTNRNDAFITGMINALWPTPGIVHNSNEANNNSAVHFSAAQSIGEMMVQGMSRVDECFAYKSSNGEYRISSYDKIQKDLYHCLGDPSISVFWNATRNLKEGASITQDKTGITIRGLQQRTIVSFYNQTTGKSCRLSGYEMFLACDTQDYVVCTFSKPGYKSCNSLFGRWIEAKPKPTDIIQSVISENRLIVVKLSEDFDFDKNGDGYILLTDMNGLPKGKAEIVEGNIIYYFNLKEPLGLGIRGTYVVSLISNGNLVDSKTVLVKNI